MVASVDAVILTILLPIKIVEISASKCSLKKYTFEYFFLSVETRFFNLILLREEKAVSVDEKYPDKKIRMTIATM
jgi:hypothetical protein